MKLPAYPDHLTLLLSAGVSKDTAEAQVTLIRDVKHETIKQVRAAIRSATPTLVKSSHNSIELFENVDKLLQEFLK